MITLEYVQHEIDQLVMSKDRLDRDSLDTLYKLMVVRHFMSENDEIEIEELDELEPEEAIEKLSEQEAKKWVSGMVSADGGKGEHWTMQQTETARNQRGIDADPVEFYAVLNMMYNDYLKVGRRYGINTLEFYTCLAEAFLSDTDAVPDKVYQYYEHIAKK